jgi:cellulose synthase/poly-beta-1,6-N-acetylglucosamine synthase-like glycosyltransferase
VDKTEIGDILKQSVRVVWGTPLRDVGFCLEDYLRALDAQDFPRRQISYFFIENNSTDETQEILHEWNPAGYWISIKDYREEPFLVENLRKAKNRANNAPFLAGFRNEIFTRAEIDGADFVALVDADIITPPNFLSRLISHNLPVVAGLVKNEAAPWEEARAYNMLEWDPNIFGFVRRNHQDMRNRGLVQVALTGAAVVIRRDVFTTCRHFADKGQTDYGFAYDCMARGFKCYVDTDLICDHRFERPGTKAPQRGVKA